MRGFLIFITICILFAQNPTQAALFAKKDYKQIFIQEALNSEKRKDNNAAFHSYEKALYYYGKDRKVLENYAQFCERQKYFEKSEMLYGKLYVLTKDQKYLFKKNLSAIKHGTLPKSEMEKLANEKSLTQAQKIELNIALVYHFAYKNDWTRVSKACRQIPIKRIDKDTIISCIVASEKTSNSKYLLDLYIRFSDINPNDTAIINRILSITEKTNNYQLQEKYLKKLAMQNPKDFGIKYRLAGFYEKNKQWIKAATIYQNLMLMGDKSEHVKASMAYVSSQLHLTPLTSTQNQAKTAEEYKPKPLSGYKLQEKLFYDALNIKNYSVAMGHLQKMLKSQPTNTKLLRHKADIYFSTENYKGAIESLEKIKKITPLSQDEGLFLAYLYLKEENYTKTFEIIDARLKSAPKNEKILGLAADYAMEAKDWDKALSYNQKLLEITPLSEKILKNMGDIYSIKKDFPQATTYYEKLVQYYPKTQYQFALSNLYMADQNFAAAQATLEPLYKEFGDEPIIVDAYLNSLLAQRKLAQAYSVVKTHHLEKTETGYMVTGDMAMKDKKYEKASTDYQNALLINPNNLVLQNKLGDSYRAQGYINGPTQIYKKVLEKDPGNLEARLGLGSLQTDQKHFKEARAIFSSILVDKPDYRPAKIATAHSYLANGDRLSTLTTLGPLLDDDESELIKGQTYYDMNMWSDSKSVLKGSATKDADALRYRIRRDDAIRITPSYTFFRQNLADQYNLNYHKFGLDVSKNIKDNTNIFMDYNVYIYSSGSQYYFNNVVNEFRTGIQSRPERQWEYRADIGVKAFEFGGAMLNTDSWIKHYFNDKFALKLGFKRDNIEQSYLSAVGANINGIFIGRSAYNKAYLEYEGKLPYQIYTYGYGAYGVVASSALDTNQYFEAMVGAGKFLYNNPKNKWINTFAFDIVSYNMGYQYNQLNIQTPLGTFGGYYSPSYFNATTGNLKLEGNIKKWRLKYGIKGFAGSQTAMSPDQISLAWGFSPYAAYDINDNVTINASYNQFHYANLIREVFMINAVIRGFKKNAKN